MGKRWMIERRRDGYYRQAKAQGYRSRAAFKLLEINSRFGLLKRGDAVVDLGAAPGGWTQVLVAKTGGTVVAVDIAAMRPVEGAVVIQGDMTDPETLDRVAAALGGPADVVVSDMAPNISGVYDVDQARSVELAATALRAAAALLRPGGSLVVKVFEGSDFPEFLAEMRSAFGRVKVFSPKASRKGSSEVYIVARRFGKKRGAAGCPADLATAGEG